MQNKLQELTDKLYNEGLSKGKQEGEELLAKAKAQVDDMLAKAQAEAAQIIAAAQKQAEEIRTKTASDIKMASSQSIAATKKAFQTCKTHPLSFRLSQRRPSISTGCGRYKR